MKKKLFEADDPLGNKISCTIGQWEYHIVARGSGSAHSVMSGNESAVVASIADPTAIFCSSDEDSEGTRWVYFGMSDIASYRKKYYTKTIVEIDERNKEGEVVSAWPQKEMKGGIDEKQLKYLKTKL